MHPAVVEARQSLVVPPFASRGAAPHAAGERVPVPPGYGEITRVCGPDETGRLRNYGEAVR